MPVKRIGSKEYTYANHSVKYALVIPGISILKIPYILRAGPSHENNSFQRVYLSLTGGRGDSAVAYFESKTPTYLLILELIDECPEDANVVMPIVDSLGESGHWFHQLLVKWWSLASKPGPTPKRKHSSTGRRKLFEMNPGEDE